ncbi:hypothetical protein SUGI_0887070 [Cryptomeria japonica]|nr:hypothetical protein SUGI_0887070 [Cryptomeria japonica]
MADDDAMSHPCRMWRPNDLTGMHEIKGFQNILRESEGKNFRCFNHIWDNENVRMTYFLEKSKKSTDLQWLELEHIFYSMCIPEWIPLKNLHTLILGGLSPQKLWQREDQAPLKLKELFCCFGEQLFIAEDVFLRDFGGQSLYCVM